VTAPTDKQSAGEPLVLSALRYIIGVGKLLTKTPRMPSSIKPDGRIDRKLALRQHPGLIHRLAQTILGAAIAPLALIDTGGRSQQRFRETFGMGTI
jgi:hypothetical protein